jgi:hypothetical protein
MWMGQGLTSVVAMLTTTLAIGCASKPPPTPVAQAEVPIRSQDEIARDQANSGTIADPAQCASKNPPPNCPRKGSNDPFQDTRTGQRLPRMLGK